MKTSPAAAVSSAADTNLATSAAAVQSAVKMPPVDNVWRLFPEELDESPISADLEPLVQMLTASRSMVLARLVALRFMSSTNPMRERFTRLTVLSAQKVLLAEEEVVDTLVNDLALALHSGPFYCSAQLHLQSLSSFACGAADRQGPDSVWEMLISEIIYNVGDCTAYALDAFRRAGDMSSEARKYGQLYCDLMEVPLQEMCADD